MISRTRRVALVAAALAVTMAACASSDADDEATTAVSSDADATTAETTAPSQPEPVTVPEALQFTAPLVGGGQFDGANVAGKPTLLWFWAPT